MCSGPGLGSSAQSSVCANSRMSDGWGQRGLQCRVASSSGSQAPLVCREGGLERSLLLFHDGLPLNVGAVWLSGVEF
jgi:hypothetical protein